jgi:anti-sigma B factor antagonist
MLPAPEVPDSILGRCEAPAAFRCWLAATRSGVIAHVAGEFDIGTTPRFARMLSEAQSRAGLVVLDLRDLAFMDTSGVHAIVYASRQARLAGRRLVLREIPAGIVHVFRLTGNLDQLDTGDTPAGLPRDASSRRAEGASAA